MELEEEDSILVAMVNLNWLKFGCLSCVRETEINLVHPSNDIKDEDIGVIPVHSHNDENQPEPLYNAWRCKCRSIEMDVHVRPDGRVLVGHNEADLRDDKTAQSMYLDPLVKLCADINEAGRLLMFDIKSDDTALAHSAIEVILRHYQDVFRASRPAGALPMFAEYTNSSDTPGIFKCVMSENRVTPDKLTAAGSWMLALDGQLTDAPQNTRIFPLVSAPFEGEDGKGGKAPDSVLMKYTGSEQDKRDLRTACVKLNTVAPGSNVRVYDTPDTLEMWRQLRDIRMQEKLDLIINTDIPSAIYTWFKDNQF